MSPGIIRRVLCFLIISWLGGASNPGRNLKPHEVKRLVDNLEDDGTVKIVWGDDSSYNGEWKDGKRNGKGTNMYPDKKIYRGHWVNDVYHGMGVLRTPSGSSYEGMWHYGVQEGQGELRYADGSLYFGDFVNNKHHGYGILKYVDGRSYEGHWENGYPSGYGILKKANGMIEFEGQFENGTPIMENNKSNQTKNEVTEDVQQKKEVGNEDIDEF